MVVGRSKYIFVEMPMRVVGRVGCGGWEDILVVLRFAGEREWSSGMMLEKEKRCD